MEFPLFILDDVKPSLSCCENHVEEDQIINMRPPLVSSSKHWLTIKQLHLPAKPYHNSSMYGCVNTKQKKKGNRKPSHQFISISTKMDSHVTCFARR